MQFELSSVPLDNDFTIISVCAQDKHLLDINYDLTASLNIAQKFVWFLVDNAPETNKKVSDNRFIYIKGVDFKEKGHLGSRSYHHAQALNLALQQVKTRYVLFLDPDCFIVRRDWIKDVLEFMKFAKLSFFGIPCHPRKYTAYRYFPYVACFFVDLEKVDQRELDFTPEIEELMITRKLRRRTLFKWFISNTRPKEVEETIEVDRSYIFDVLIRKLVYKFWVDKIRSGDIWIGSSGDTGSRIYRRFNNDPAHRYEYAVPVWSIDKKMSALSKRQKIKEKLVPDVLSIIPKRKGYFTNVTFSDLGRYDVDSAFNCESYLWRGAPFCFHVRSIGLQHLTAEAFKESIDSFVNESALDKLATLGK